LDFGFADALIKAILFGEVFAKESIQSATRKFIGQINPKSKI
jgi:hypothetical protein